MTYDDSITTLYFLYVLWFERNVMTLKHLLKSVHCKHTIKFCCSGDHEYMTGTEATALRVFSGITCLGNSEKPLSTVHWTKRRERQISENKLKTSSAHQHLWNWPLGFLSKSRQTSWCEWAEYAWSSTPGSKCRFASWFYGDWCWTCSGTVEEEKSLKELHVKAKCNMLLVCVYGPTLTSSARLKRLSCRSLMYSDLTLFFQQAGPFSERFPVSTMINLQPNQRMSLCDVANNSVLISTA